MLDLRGGEDRRLQLVGRVVVCQLVVVAVAADQVSKVVEAITTSAKTGQIGDGKIFVFAIDHAVRIRTGEVDADAL